MNELMIEKEQIQYHDNVIDSQRLTQSNKIYTGFLRLQHHLEGALGELSISDKISPIQWKALINLLTEKWCFYEMACWGAQHDEEAIRTLEEEIQCDVENIALELKSQGKRFEYLHYEAMEKGYNHGNSEIFVREFLDYIKDAGNALQQALKDGTFMDFV